MEEAVLCSGEEAQQVAGEAGVQLARESSECQSVTFTKPLLETKERRGGLGRTWGPPPFEGKRRTRGAKYRIVREMEGTLRG